MRAPRWSGVLVVGVFLVPVIALGAPRSAPSRAAPPRAPMAPAVIDNTGILNVNSLDMVVTNHGSFAYDLEQNNGGLYYPTRPDPTSIGNTVVFAAGLWIGAKVNGQVRVAVSEYAQEFAPGPLTVPPSDPNDPRYRNYKLQRLPSGAIDSTTSDYLNWPVADGAPTDSLGRPQLLGDMMIWSVYNDNDPSFHSGTDAGGTAPLGIEVRQSTFAFKETGPLANVIFVKFQIINKGGNQLDDAYVALWSDPDLGGFTDDLVGCDTTFSLGFCYNSTNSDQQYGAEPPAVGYDFFRGPITDVDNDGDLDTLGMTSFNKYINGTDPRAPAETYNYMSGLNRDGSLIHVCDDPALPVTRYQVSGLDPGAPEDCEAMVTPEFNWLDSNPADRRLFLSSGPFSMAPGDTQEVVAAIIVGQATDRIASIVDMKDKDAAAQDAFDSNFALPPPIPPPTVVAQPIDRGVQLNWGSEPVGYVGTGAGKEFHFEGFKVYQLEAYDPTAGQPGRPRAVLIATYDEENGIQKIFFDEKNPAAGAVERRLKASGTDSGLEFSLSITQDYLRGSGLVNYRDYYFAVTGYAYNVADVEPYLAGPGIVSEVKESSFEQEINMIRVSPQPIAAEFDVDVTQVAGTPGVGTITVEQPIPDQQALTGDLYEVEFTDQETWSLRNVTDNTTLLTGQTTISGEPSPIVEGVVVRVTAERGVELVAERLPGGGLHDMFPGTTDTTGTWAFDPDIAADLSRLVRFPPAPPNDYEIRTLPDTTEYAWVFEGGDPSHVADFKVPIEVWNLGLNSLGDSSDDVKISAMVLDNDANGRFNWGDGLYFRDIPYASVSWTTPGTLSTDYVPDGSDQHLGRFFFLLVDGTFTGEWPAPTTILVHTKQFSAGDRFQFRSVPQTRPGSGGKEDLKRILAVPNPYYGASQYELTQFNRVMKFTNIPSSRRVNIRIFTLAGDPVRTLRREANDPETVSTSAIVWDLQNENRLPVASGVYIYIVEVEGIGTKTDRLAVFHEEERLDDF